MREWYFYQERGKTMGPLTADDIRARVRDGRIGTFDLIYKDGETGWRMAMEHAEFRSEFQKPVDASLKDRPWVCLKRKSPESLDFVTAGPFSFEEVRQSLMGGELSYSDYIWRQEFNEWKRIGSLADFNPRVKVAPKEPKSVEENVIVFNRMGETRKTADDLVDDDEADKGKDADDATRVIGPSLERTRIAVPDDDERTRIIAPVVVPKDERTRIIPAAAPVRKSAPPEPPPGPVRAKARVEPPRSPTDWTRLLRASKNVDLAIVAGVVLVLLVSVIWVSRRSDRVPVPDVPVATIPGANIKDPPTELSPPAPDHQGVDTLGPVAGEPELPANPPAVKIPPTRLSLVARPQSSNQAYIQIRSNGSLDFPIFMQIVGLPGQVADAPAYYRFYRFESTGEPIELSQLSLSMGKYVVRVESGGVRREAVLRLGTSEALYRQGVAKQRKLASASFWRERLQVYRLSRELEDGLKEALARKQALPAKAKYAPIQAVTAANGNRYLLFEQWWELKQIFSEARTRATPELVARAAKLSDRLRSFSVWNTN